MVLALAKAPMLVEGGGSAEHLPTVFTLDLVRQSACIRL